MVAGYCKGDCGEGNTGRGATYGERSCELACEAEGYGAWRGGCGGGIVAETQNQRPKGERHENAERGRGGGVVDGAGLRADPEYQPDAGTHVQIAGGEGGGSDQG